VRFAELSLACLDTTNETNAAVEVCVSVANHTRQPNLPAAIEYNVTNLTADAINNKPLVVDLADIPVHVSLSMVSDQLIWPMLCNSGRSLAIAATLRSRLFHALATAIFSQTGHLLGQTLTPSMFSQNYPAEGHPLARCPHLTAGHHRSDLVVLEGEPLVQKIAR
jgi:hypothetical protein